MKHLLKISLFAMVAMVLVSTACKSNKDKSPSEILTNVGEWKLSKIEYRPTNSSIWTVEPLEPCRGDDINTFFKGGSGTFDEGPTKCASYEPQSRTGSWTVSGDNKTLTVSDVSVSFEGEIDEISDSKLLLIAYNASGSGEDYRFTYLPR